MFVKQLRLDRFGSWNDARVDGLGPGLHVLRGKGRAAVHFVRSILFGFDTRSRQAFLPAESRGFGGAITVSTPAGLQTISRYDDGSTDGRLTVEHADGSLIGRRHVQELLAGVSAATYAQLFAVDFSERPHIRDLIREARTAGVDVAQGIDGPQVQELRQLLARKRGELALIPSPSLSLDELGSRRRQLAAEAENLDSQLLHCARNEHQRHFESDIEKLRQDLEHEQRTLRHIELLLEERTAERREQLHLQAEAAATHPHDDEQAQELTRLEEQLARWQLVLREIVERKQTLQPLVPEIDSTVDSAEVRQHLRSLEQQIGELRTRYQDVEDDAGHHPQLRSHYSAQLHQLQEMVYRMCCALSESEFKARETAWSQELAQLKRCERELKSAIQHLSHRRRQLMAQWPQSDRLISRREHTEFCRCHDHPQVHKSAGPDHAQVNRKLAQLEAEIAEIERRRDNSIKTLDELDAELTEARVRLAQLGDHQRAELVRQQQACQEQLKRVEQDLEHAQRRHDLVVATAQLEQEIERAEAVRSSSVLERASASLRRLSGGDFNDLEIVGQEAFVRDEHNQRIEWSKLADGARDQVYLALSLSVVTELHHRGVDLPLVFHAAFTYMESRDVPEAAEVMRDFAQQGPQVIFCTRHEHVIDVFRLCNASIHDISLQVKSESSSAPKPPRNTDLEDREWDLDEAPQGQPDRSEISWPHPSPAHGAPAAELAPFYLSEGCPIEDAPSMDEANAVRLRKIGVLTVGNLLHLVPARAADQLRYAAIGEEQIRSWQAQARLVCRVPHLRPYDARILVACGVAEPEQLSRMQPAQVREIVQRFAGSSRGQAVLMSGTEFELSRVTEWIKDKQHTNGRSHSVGRDSSHHQANARAAASGQRESADANAEPNVLKIDRSTGWKFYLDTGDAIVDAPSIGPRTAERLDAAGIQTVADLLRADPEELAERLQHNRTNADTIRQWQQQTSLACRIPQLRGHDAQILVALGFTDPAELARQQPQELWDKVAPFLGTNQGKRIIRNGKLPDIEEVADWIRWAGAARTLNAA